MRTEELLDVYLVYTNLDSNTDLIVETTWVADDMELIMNNINVLLSEIDLEVLN